MKEAEVRLLVYILVVIAQFGENLALASPCITVRAPAREVRRTSTCPSQRVRGSTALTERA
jgi:hypothetical protein